MYPIADRIADLSLIWKQASQIFPYFDQKPIDWDQLYRSYIPRVINAETELDFHLLLMEFVNLLGDGHTDYSPPRALQEQRGFLPFTLRMVEGAYCIDSAAPSFSQYLSQPIRCINGTPIDSILSTLSRYSYHIDQFIPAWRMHQLLPFLLKPTENIVSTDIGDFSFDLQPNRPLNLPEHTLHSPADYRQIPHEKIDFRLYESNLLYIRLDDFMYGSAADAIKAVLLQFPQIKGLIIDLRENIGGMTLHGANIAKLLISGQFQACSKRTRSMTGLALSSASQLMQWSKEEIEAHIAAGYSTREEIEESFSFAHNTHFDRYNDVYGSKEHKAIFSGPCVLLTSRHTVSAAEDFIAMFRTNRRALVVGTPTCGTTGTPYLKALSCGGRLRICSVAYQLLDGTPFIGCGIAPDIPCELSLQDYQKGYDRVLMEGLAILKSKI